MEHSGERCLTVKDLEEILGISPRQVFRLKAAGELPRPFRVGSRGVRWRPREIDRWLDGGGFVGGVTRRK